MERYRIKPGTKVDLSQWDPNDTSAFKGDKEQATQELQQLNRRLDRLQDLLYAEHKHKFLAVLQAMDTGGKDGTIRHVFEGVNPQGVQVAGFKAPTPVELDHDFLWRVHPHVPGKGEMVIFNRSHYEDVLIVRVHRLIEPHVWRQRFEAINHFEHELANEGTTIVKFYLHISPEEQKERLQERLDEPQKQWKFNVDDIRERQLWRDYMKAYEDAIAATSTEWAPWYIVPANHKWYRNLVVSSVIVQALEALKMAYPQPTTDLSKVVIE